MQKQECVPVARSSIAQGDSCPPVPSDATGRGVCAESAFAFGRSRFGAAFGDRRNELDKKRTYNGSPKATRGGVTNIPE